jgi:class 3 adenylate cyclase/tetratricopeptide (TPR) repeat protein
MSVRNISDVESLLSGNPTARELYSVWGSLPEIPWLDDLSLAPRFTAQVVVRQEFLLVLDASRKILRRWPKANANDRPWLARVRMDYATALTRLGSLREARHELEPCLAADVQPALGRKLKCDIFLQLGKILREEWLAVTDRAAQIGTAQEALSFYRRALELDHKRLDALALRASTALILSQLGEDLRRESEDTARSILEVARELKDSDGPRFDITSAEATAHAVLGDSDSAARSFQEMPQTNGVTTAALAEARFQAQFLSEALGKPRDFFNAAFPPLQLLVFAGHLPDRPGEQLRFPSSAIPAVRDEIRERLKSMQARFGLLSASAGADLLFIEALLGLGGSLHLVLPWSQEEFRRTSILPYEPANGPPQWEPLYETALAKAETTREIGQVYEPGSDVGWQFSMEVTAGLALHTARALRLDIQPIVLWDGHPGRGAGGTESFHNLWSQKLKKEVVVIPLRDVAQAAVSGSFNRGCERPILHQEVKSMLFADIVGYSKLTEKVMPEFISTFLQRLGQLTATSRHAPCSVNTWGDAMYAVFDFARDAGMFALELAQMVEDGKQDWLAKGLYWETRTSNEDVERRPISFRIGLHSGPVVMHFDPVVRRIGFTGSHVNRAARIEPVAEPGQVYASEEFVAIAELGSAVQQAGPGGSDAGSELGFVCEYAGSMQLAKSYPGRHRIYRVVPRRALAIESLARAAHEAYCEEARARGETSSTNASLRPWDDLSEDLKSSNRAQVGDIPTKLRAVGLELTVSGGMPATEIALTDAQTEDLAIREHDRWVAERKRNGWTYAPIRDNARKHHPLLVPWGELQETEKEKDRATIRNLPRLVEKAGFRVRPV